MKESMDEMETTEFETKETKVSIPLKELGRLVGIEKKYKQIQDICKQDIPVADIGYKVTKIIYNIR